MIQQIICQGTPYEIGFIHGTEAVAGIEGSIAFYAELFMKYSKKTWPEVQETARIFEAVMRDKWPRYREELRGIADGSKRHILDIVALNVRTEIAFGLFSDGCTSVFWETPDTVYLGQNWDWMQEQKKNLIILTIHQHPLPTIKMVTEAGILGKIGLNSAGVGVCFNAIRVVGLDATRMPCHLGLRTVLECTSAPEAVLKLEAAGMAASAHILVGDAAGKATGLEFTRSTFAKLSKSEAGIIVHSNHLIAEHEGFSPQLWMVDSIPRLGRMTALSQRAGNRQPSWKAFSELFEDQEGFPTAICRAQEGVSTSATLFNIVMDLKAKKAVVKLGRPCAAEETVEMSFE